MTNRWVCVILRSDATKNLRPSTFRTVCGRSMTAPTSSESRSWIFVGAITDRPFGFVFFDAWEILPRFAVQNDRSLGDPAKPASKFRMTNRWVCVILRSDATKNLRPSTFRTVCGRSMTAPTSSESRSWIFVGAITDRPFGFVFLISRRFFTASRFRMTNNGDPAKPALWGKGGMVAAVCKFP